MPREPKPGTFVVKSAILRPVPTADAWVAIDEVYAVPPQFTVTFELSEPLYVVTIDVVMKGSRPSVRRIEAIHGERVKDGLTVIDAEGGGVTTTGLRQVLVDQLVRRAVDLARGRRDLLSSARSNALVSLPADTVGEAFRVLEVTATGRPSTKVRIAQAAELYKKAVANGSDAPQKDVAIAMGFSTSQVSRYLKSARENGLLDRRAE